MLMVIDVQYMYKVKFVIYIYVLCFDIDGEVHIFRKKILCSRYNKINIWLMRARL